MSTSDPQNPPILLKSAPMVAAKIATMQKLRETLKTPPKLLIIRDSDNPVIVKYVNLKIQFGAKIKIPVEDFLAKTPAAIADKISLANSDPAISGLILQLPIKDPSQTEHLCSLISPQKDVDGLNSAAPTPVSVAQTPSPNSTSFLPATVKAILDLLDFYKIDLTSRRIAVVGRGKLVGAPLLKALRSKHLSPTNFHRGSNLSDLKNFDLIITATGSPALIKSADISPGTVLVDAGTASEKGVLKGDLSPELYDRPDLAAITPRLGGVGPATVACLFENLLTAAQNQLNPKN